MVLIIFAQFMRDLREATIELLMQGLAMELPLEEVIADGHYDGDDRQNVDDIFDSKGLLKSMICEKFQFFGC